MTHRQPATTLGRSSAAPAEDPAARPALPTRRALLAGGLGTALTSGCTGDPPSPAPPLASTPASGAGAATTDAGSGRAAALGTLLQARARAITEHDRAAFAATLADPRSAYGRRQLAAYDAMQLLPLAEVGYGPVRAGPALSTDRAAALGPGAWVARVEGRYRFSGYDTGPRTYDTCLTAVPTSAGWRLADDADGSSQPQPWDLPGLRVVHTPTSLVMGNVPQATLRSYLAAVDGAVTRVDSFWKRPWPRRLVVVAPDTVAQLQAQLSTHEGDVSQVAAFTDGVVGAASTAHSDRIVVNPQAFADLLPAGRTVVLTHESTHVAVRASLPGRVPLWVSEGTADLVGYSTVRLPDVRIAGALVARVKASGMPRGLPMDAEFDAATTTIAPVYNQAWLAVRLIDRSVGAQGLTRFYAACASGGSDSDVVAATEKAFHDVLHTTQAQFTTRWRTEVRRLTGG